MKHTHYCFEAIIANQSAIAKALNIELPFNFDDDDDYDLDDDPLSMLSPELRCKLTDEDAFARAFDEELLEIVDGKIVSNLSKTMTGYLLGRMFVGDYPQQTGKFSFWKSGKRTFPESALAMAFHPDSIHNVRESRQKKLNLRVPEQAYLVDNLFIEITNK